jgi:hypothetical protein
MENLLICSKILSIHYIG